VPIGEDIAAIVFDTLLFMKTTFIILACVLTSCLTHGQKLPGRHATKNEQELMDKSQDCARVKSVPLAERLKHYPFDRAKDVKLVSFKSSYDSAFGEYYEDSLPRKNDTVCFSKMFEIITLTPSQVDTLTDLIYNYGFKFNYKPKGNVYFISSIMECYNPRNAILFLDKSNQVFEFIEICFECKKTRTSSDNVSLGTACNQKLLLIKDLFREAGIKYGVSE
jgi:hypothetical protein